VSLPATANEVLPFDTLDELSRIFLRDLPAIALVWYLSRRSLASDPFIRPRRSDTLVAFGGFVVLALVSTGTGLAASFFSSGEAEAFIESPTNPVEWLIAIASCIATGYLEESYFRGYLISKIEALGIAIPQTIAVAVTLFALCHLYEGPWGTINAVFAGTVLSLTFIRYRSIHPIAWAHAAYNAFVYVSGTI